jgi:hypothetical protein
MREAGLNISRLIENAVRQYLSTSTNIPINVVGPLPSLEPGKVVVIERDAYFNNVCRELLKTYDRAEILQLKIDTTYKNAISLMYRICNQAFAVTRG